jgi:hypothetical protein
MPRQQPEPFESVGADDADAEAIAYGELPLDLIQGE